MSVLDQLSAERREPLLHVMAAMRERAARRGDSVSIRPSAVWIAFRSDRAGRVFAEVRPARRGLQAFLLPPRCELRDPNGDARQAPETQGWGWFRTKVLVPEDGIHHLVSLLTQSLDYAYRLPPPRRRAAKPASRPLRGARQR